MGISKTWAFFFLGGGGGGGGGRGGSCSSYIYCPDLVSYPSKQAFILSDESNPCPVEVIHAGVQSWCHYSKRGAVSEVPLEP